MIIILKSNLDRNVHPASRGRRCDSFQAAGTAEEDEPGTKSSPGHLSLPLWCQSRHPGRDQFCSHLTPCRTNFSIIYDVNP